MNGDLHDRPSAWHDGLAEALGDGGSALMVLDANPCRGRCAGAMDGDG